MYLFLFILLITYFYYFTIIVKYIQIRTLITSINHKLYTSFYLSILLIYKYHSKLKKTMNRNSIKLQLHNILA
jgi:hypothetical protein